MTPLHEMDYVFNPESAPEEFHQVKITIQQEKGKLAIYLQAENGPMSVQDVQGVLAGLEASFLKRRQISLLDDCVVYVQAEGKSFSAALVPVFKVEKLVSVQA